MRIFNVQLKQNRHEYRQAPKTLKLPSVGMPIESKKPYVLIAFSIDRSPKLKENTRMDPSTLLETAAEGVSIELIDCP